MDKFEKGDIVVMLSCAGFYGGIEHHGITTDKRWVSWEGRKAKILRKGRIAVTTVAPNVRLISIKTVLNKAIAHFCELGELSRFVSNQLRYNLTVSDLFDFDEVMAYIKSFEDSNLDESVWCTDE